MTKSRWWIPNALGGLLSLLTSIVLLMSTRFAYGFVRSESIDAFLLQGALACLALFGAGFAVAVAPAPAQNASKVASMTLFIIAAFALIGVVFVTSVLGAALSMG